jgi:RNA polymerase sigma factor (sigma-70 family)
MTARKNSDEITRALIADASNPDACERVAIVPPSTSPRPDWYGKPRHPNAARSTDELKYYWHVFRYFRANRIGDDEAHDLSQDTFKRLYERMDQIRFNDHPWPVLATIATTVLLNRVRARQTQKRSATIVEIDDPEVLFTEPAAPAELDYADQQAQEAVRERVRKAVASLPPGQRESLRLWNEGYQYSEIAKILGISMDAVKSRLRDAKRYLREQLGETDPTGMPSVTR